jgi:hypothetical protein
VTLASALSILVALWLFASLVRGEKAQGLTRPMRPILNRDGLSAGVGQYLHKTWVVLQILAQRRRTWYTLNVGTLGFFDLNAVLRPPALN